MYKYTHKQIYAHILQVFMCQVLKRRTHYKAQNYTRRKCGWYIEFNEKVRQIKQEKLKKKKKFNQIEEDIYMYIYIYRWHGKMPARRHTYDETMFARYARIRTTVQDRQNVRYRLGFDEFPFKLALVWAKRQCKCVRDLFLFCPIPTLSSLRAILFLPLYDECKNIM